MSKHKSKRKDRELSKPMVQKPQDHQVRSHSRRNILYALAAGTAIVIAFGIFAPQKKPVEYKLSYPTQPADVKFTGARLLASDAPIFAFGRISMAAGKVSHRYSIRNTGITPLTINKIYTSCMCTEATLITRSAKRGPFGMAGHGILPSVSERLAPGEAAQVDVVFDPAAHGPAGVGPTDRVVTIANDAGPALELRFSAMVTP